MARGEMLRVALRGAIYRRALGIPRPRAALWARPWSGTTLGSSRGCSGVLPQDVRCGLSNAGHRGLCSSWQPPSSPSTNPKMYMVFTCGNCETRSVKSFAKSSYEKGVVLVQCPGCQKRHVIADNLGWFGAEKNVEEILALKGESVRRITDVDLGDEDGGEGCSETGDDDGTGRVLR